MRIAWHDVVFYLPDHWEVTCYSIASQVGRLEFTDRQGALGVLSWETCKRLPDEERILTEHHRRYLKQYDKDAFQRFAVFDTRRIGAFLVGHPADGAPCSAVTHLARQSKVLMWSFPSFSPEKLERIWRPILESFQPNDGDWRAWSLFGLRCQLPRDVELEESACKPADVWMAFERRNLHKIDLHRWGLPREVLRTRDLESFFRDVLRGHEGRVLTSRRDTFRGMESVSVTAEVRGTHGMDKLFASRWRGAGRIWHDKDEKRIYAWVQSAPRKVDLLGEQELLSP
jgi:hypothetical protein